MSISLYSIIKMHVSIGVGPIYTGGGGQPRHFGNFLSENSGRETERVRERDRDRDRERGYNREREGDKKYQRENRNFF